MSTAGWQGSSLALANKRTLAETTVETFATWGTKTSASATGITALLLIVTVDKSEAAMTLSLRRGDESCLGRLRPAQMRLVGLVFEKRNCTKQYSGRSNPDAECYVS